MEWGEPVKPYLSGQWILACQESSKHWLCQRFFKTSTMDFLDSIVLYGKCIRTSTFTCYVKVIYIFFLSFLKVARESSASETRIRIINLIESIELMVLVEPPLRCSISHLFSLFIFQISNDPVMNEVKYLRRWKLIFSYPVFHCVLCYRHYLMLYF